MYLCHCTTENPNENQTQMVNIVFLKGFSFLAILNSSEIQS